MIPKAIKIKLAGKALKELYLAVWKRDRGRCIRCGAPVPAGTTPHHEPQGALRSDEINKMVILCYKCHFERHHTALTTIIKEFCKKYLKKIYGGE